MAKLFLNIMAKLIFLLANKKDLEEKLFIKIIKLLS